REGAMNQRVQTARLIGHVRWAGVALGLVQVVLLNQPIPIGGAMGILIPAVVMAAYNLPVALLRRMPRGAVELIVLAAVAGDFAVVSTWTLLTANDQFSTSYAAYGLVAIEAAFLYRWRGAVAFSAAFGVMFAAFYVLRLLAFGFMPEVGSVVYRSGIVLLTAVFTGGITTVSERRRERYESLLGAISDLGQGLVITESGRLIYGNEAYQRITGYS